MPPRREKAFRGDPAQRFRPPLGARTLMSTATEGIFKLLPDSLLDREPTANFACGGSVLIGAQVTEVSSIHVRSRAPTTCPPVVIRWDDSDGEPNGKITFPTATGSNALEKFRADCDHAPFKINGNTISDRNVMRMRANRFSTNFNPYNCGIIDTVAQTLLPDIRKPDEVQRKEREQDNQGKKAKQGENTDPSHWGVLAELCEAIICSDPSGTFKTRSAVDRELPRVDRFHFGSLVVCLPYPHQGGKMKLLHQNSCGQKHEKDFDFASKKDEHKIRWVAFYGNSEQEFLPVTSGHQIILTYKLFVSERVGGLVHPTHPTADPTLYPLYDRVRGILGQGYFMPKGGKIGWYCQHSYDHTNSTANERLPHCLRGRDAAIYSIFRRLGFTVHVRPVLKDRWYEFEEWSLNEEWEWSDTEDPDTFYEKYDKLADRHKFVLRAGKSFWPTTVTANSYSRDENGEAEWIQEHWNYDLFEDVNFINGDIWTEDGFQRIGELALAWYDETIYETLELDSFVAIIVEIPAWLEREIPK